MGQAKNRGTQAERTARALEVKAEADARKAEADAQDAARREWLRSPSGIAYQAAQRESYKTGFKVKHHIPRYREMSMTGLLAIASMGGMPLLMTPRPGKEPIAHIEWRKDPDEDPETAGWPRCMICGELIEPTTCGNCEGEGGWRGNSPDDGYASIDCEECEDGVRYECYSDKCKGVYRDAEEREPRGL